MVTPYVNRVLGAQRTGVYSYTFANAHYFLLFAMLGLNNYGSRTIAAVRAENEQKVGETFYSIYALQLIHSVLAVAAYLGYALFLPVDDRCIVLLQAFYVMSALLDVNWFFAGLEKFKLTAMRNSLVKLTSVVLIFLLVKEANDLWLYTLIMSGSFLASAMILWGYILKHYPVMIPRFTEVKRHIKPNLVLFVPVVAISLYNVMDKIMIGKILMDKRQVSFYENAYRVMELPGVFITALGTVMLPRMTHVVNSGEKEKGMAYIENSMFCTLFISVPVSLGLAAVSDCLAPVYFGEEFTICGLFMKYLAPVGIIKAWANVIRTQYLLPNKKDKVYVISVVAGALVNVVANLILISTIGTLGAIIGTLIAEAMVMLVQTIYAAGGLPVGKYFVKSLPVLVLGIIMYIVVWWAGTKGPLSILTVLLQIVLGVVVYGVPGIAYFCVVMKRKERA